MYWLASCGWKNTLLVQIKHVQVIIDVGGFLTLEKCASH